MPGIRIYLDTSVFSALLDERAPDRQNSTQAFWLKRAGVITSTSDVARRELTNTNDEQLRENLLALLDDVLIHPVTAEIEALALRYVEERFFTIGQLDDALHVAAAVVTQQDVLLSWNFRHLVNRGRRASINAYNIHAGLPTVEIISPPEL